MVEIKNSNNWMLARINILPESDIKELVSKLDSNGFKYLFLKRLAEKSEDLYIMIYDMTMEDYIKLKFDCDRLVECVNTICTEYLIGETGAMFRVNPKDTLSYFDLTQIFDLDEASLWLCEKPHPSCFGDNSRFVRVW